MRRIVSSAATDREWSWATLLLAIPFLFLANGKWMVPAAAWLAPVFLLRFVRTQRAAVGIAVGFLVAWLVTLVVWKGLIPAPGMLYVAICSAFALAYFLPFALDRWIAPRVGGFTSTLVFPAAWVSVEWLVSSTNPYGSWGDVAYTQADALPLIQIVSVTGLWGVAFLVAWLASIVSWAWERRFEWRVVRAGLATYAVTLAAVLVLGGLRLGLAPPRGETIRVAGLTVRPSKGAAAAYGLLSPSFDTTTLEAIRKDTRALQDELLAQAAREARAGAKIVLWSECNGLVVKQDQEDFIRRGRDLARTEGIWLFMALASATPRQPRYENILVAIAPDGKIAYRYHKARPVPSDPETGADKTIPAAVATSYGRLGGAICFDMDFHGMLRRAGKQRTDILLVPSSDWKDIDPIHTRMAVFRGIENGCSVVRQTNKGLAMAADYEGRTLAATDFFRSADHHLVAEVPTKGVVTIYSRIGDLFAWACLAAFALFAGAAAGARPGRL